VSEAAILSAQAVTMCIQAVPLCVQALRAGAVDADRAVAARMLSEGYSVGVLVGGEQEQLLAQPGEARLYATP
jgi:hypothetical protein